MDSTLDPTSPRVIGFNSKQTTGALELCRRVRAPLSTWASYPSTSIFTNVGVQPTDSTTESRVTSEDHASVPPAREFVVSCRTCAKRELLLSKAIEHTPPRSDTTQHTSKICFCKPSL